MRIAQESNNIIKFEVIITLTEYDEYYKQWEEMVVEDLQKQVNGKRLFVDRLLKVELEACINFQYFLKSEISKKYPTILFDCSHIVVKMND